jgi:hypothetical protein
MDKALYYKSLKVWFCQVFKEIIADDLAFRPLPVPVHGILVSRMCLIGRQIPGIVENTVNNNIIRGWSINAIGFYAKLPDLGNLADEHPESVQNILNGFVSFGF